MTPLPFLTRKILWWRPRGALTNSATTLPVLAFACLTLSLGMRPATVLWISMAMLLSMQILMAGTQIGFASSSEAFALMPGRPSALRASLLVMASAALCIGLGFGALTGQWLSAGLITSGLGLLLILMTSVSSAGTAQLKPARFLLNVLGIGALMLLMTLLAVLKRKMPGLPAELLLLPPALALSLLLLWRLSRVGQWQAETHSASRWAAPVSVMSAHAWNITFMQILLAGLVFARNPYGLYLLAGLIPLQSLAILQARQIRDAMMRHWLAGLDRPALWRPALLSCAQLTAGNLLLLLLALEAFKHLPDARVAGLVTGQITLACAALPLALWHLVQITRSRREQDAGWLGFQTAELPGFGPMRSSRNLIRLLSQGRQAKWSGLIFPLLWSAASVYLAWFCQGDVQKLLSALVPLALAASLAALPPLWRGLREVEL